MFGFVGTHICSNNVFDGNLPINIIKIGDRPKCSTNIGSGNIAETLSMGDLVQDFVGPTRDNLLLNELEWCCNKINDNLVISDDFPTMWNIPTQTCDPSFNGTGGPTSMMCICSGMDKHITKHLHLLWVVDEKSSHGSKASNDCRISGSLADGSVRWHANHSLRFPLPSAKTSAKLERSFWKWYHPIDVISIPYNATDVTPSFKAVHFCSIVPGIDNNLCARRMALSKRSLVEPRYWVLLYFIWAPRSFWLLTKGMFPISWQTVFSAWVSSRLSFLVDQHQDFPGSALSFQARRKSMISRIVWVKFCIEQEVISQLSAKLHGVDNPKFVMCWCQTKQMATIHGTLMGSPSGIPVELGRRFELDPAILTDLCRLLRSLAQLSTMFLGTPRRRSVCIAGYLPIALKHFWISRQNPKSPSCLNKACSTWCWMVYQMSMVSRRGKPPAIDLGMKLAKCTNIFLASGLVRTL